MKCFTSGVLALCLMLLGGVKLPALAADGVPYTYHNGAICTGNADGVSYADSAKTRLVVDFAGIPDTSVTEVVFGDGVALSCVAKIVEVEFRNTTDGRVKTFTISAGVFRLNADKPPLKAITFPRGLETLNIEADAFWQSMNPMETLVFPDDVVTLNIGDRAFQQSPRYDGNGSRGLSSIIFPTSLRTLAIGDHSFSQTARSWPTPVAPLALRNLAFPEGLETLTIGEKAFYDDARGSELESITFPSTLKWLDVGAHAFSQMYLAYLKNLEFPEALDYLHVGEYAFSQHPDTRGNTALESVTFPSRMETLLLDEGAFSQQSATSTTLRAVEFPAGLETLTVGVAAFHQMALNGSTSLASVKFADDLPELQILKRAFMQMSIKNGSAELASIHFPAELTELTIDEGAFIQDATAGETRLETVKFPDKLEELKIGYMAFEQLAEVATSLASLEFPNTLRSLEIGSYAFYQNAASSTSLAELKLPNSLEHIRLADYAFYQYSPTGVTTLHSVLFPAEVETLHIGYRVFCQYAPNGSTALQRFMFPTAKRPAKDELELGQSITQLFAGNPTRNAVLPWFWLGENDVLTNAAWSDVTGTGAGTHKLFSYGSVTFDPNGGTLSGFTADEPYTVDVFPEWTSYNPTFEFTPKPLAAVTIPNEPTGIASDLFAWHFVGWSTKGVAVPQTGDFLPSEDTKFQTPFGATLLTAHWAATGSDAAEVEFGGTTAFLYPERDDNDAAHILATPTVEVSDAASAKKAAAVESAVAISDDTGKVTFDAAGLTADDYEFAVVYRFDDGYTLQFDYKVTVLPNASNNGGDGDGDGGDDTDDGDNADGGDDTGGGDDKDDTDDDDKTDGGGESDDTDGDGADDGDSDDDFRNDGDNGSDNGDDSGDDSDGGDDTVVVNTGGASAASSNSGALGLCLLLLAAGAGLLTRARRIFIRILIRAR